MITMLLSLVRRKERGDQIEADRREVGSGTKQLFASIGLSVCCTKDELLLSDGGDQSELINLSTVAQLCLLC